MEPSRPRLDVVRHGDVIVVSLLDRRILDEYNIARIEEQLFMLADSQPAVRLVLDFANVEHLSSRALGTMISLMKRVRASRGRLVLCGISPRIFEVFKITRLDQSFEIYPSRDESLAALSGPEPERSPGR